ncbi:MAG: serine hydrolase domain-containing protein [Paracoccaceae bacterium]
MNTATTHTQFSFETDSDPAFVELWPATANARFRSFGARPVRRSHGDSFVPNTLGFHGPIFDRTRMARNIRDQMTRRGAVGFSWAIVQNGQLVDAGGVGYARTQNETDQRNMTFDTRMVSASLAKPVCAVTVMKLVEDRQLALTDAAYPIIEPTFPGGHDTLNEITVKDLLTHQSGADVPALLSSFPGTLTNPLANAPGFSTKYENWNYWFLAYVVEAITGRPYFDVANETVLEPMGIDSMTREVDANAPCLYYNANSTSGGGTWGDFTATAIGAYGWFASAIDWAKFMAHFRYDTVLARPTRQVMLNAPETFFGFRHWDNEDRGSYYGHGGDFSRSSGAFHGGMMGFPDGIDAVLLTNSDDVPNPENILIDAYHAAYV